MNSCFILYFRTGDAPHRMGNPCTPRIRQGGRKKRKNLFQLKIVSKWITSCHVLKLARIHPNIPYLRYMTYDTYETSTSTWLKKKKSHACCYKQESFDQFFVDLLLLDSYMVFEMVLNLRNDNKLSIITLQASSPVAVPARIKIPSPPGKG